MIKKISEYILNNKRHWNKLVTVLAVFVAVCTVSALILPATTMEGTTCEIEEHVHTLECYEPILVEKKSVPCELKEVIAHEHTDECYGVVALNEVETVSETTSHEHTDACYIMVRTSDSPECGLEESAGHTHSKETGCYEESVSITCGLEESEGHTHTSECENNIENTEVVCGLGDTEGHVHEDSCFNVTVTTEYKCGQEASAGHAHTDACKEVKETLVCEQGESEGHTHTDECYKWEKTLSCTIEPQENEPQIVAEEAGQPQKTEKKLVCGKEEIVPHTHSEACLDGENNLICGLEEIVEHVHSEECSQIVEEPVNAEELTCGLDESTGHVHSVEEGCFDENGNQICELEESEGHLHGELCYGKWELKCEKAEHTHNEECTPILKLTEEERKQVEDVITMIAALPTYEEIEAEILKFAEIEDEEGEEAYYTEIMLQARAAYEAYNVLTEDQKLFVSNADKLMDLEFLWGMAILDPEEEEDASKIEPLLNGDFAYISEMRLKAEGGLTTGTAPFNNEDGPGKDRTDNDNILRTFDIASYMVEFMTALRQDVIEKDISGYEKGRLFFEIILPVSEEQAIFELDGMLWLQSSQEIKYEKVTETINGKTCQILRGSYMLLPSGDNPAAIGASQNEMSIALRALKMHHGDIIKPEVTLWLEHNDVGAEYKDNIPTSIVNGNKHSCSDVDGKEKIPHGEEAKTLKLDEITISAGPRYNLKLAGTTSTQMTASGTYDFSTGNEFALNKDAGSIYGRLSGTGILLEIDARDSFGMKGVELPSTEHPITFTLNLSSKYILSNKEEASAAINAEYQPLFYSGDGNRSSDISSFDGRKVNTYRKNALTVPFNTGANYQSCYDGGTWKFEADGENRVKVTVTGFKINTDNDDLAKCFPYGTSDNSTVQSTYYDPKNVEKWWDIKEAVFSAGEIWVLQPYNNAAGRYIVDRAGSEGQFVTTITATDFRMTSANNDTVTVQTNLVDDTVQEGRFLKNPGSITGFIAYLKNPNKGWDDALTEGANETDNDWAVAGQPVGIRTHTAYNGTTERYRAVATNQLVKWDDKFFEPSSTAVSNPNYFEERKNSATVLWAAKPDGKGWIDDEEMRKATVDDLVYYKNLQELKEAGAVAVGALEERRGLQADGGHNVMFHIRGKIKSDCEPNKVYMTVRNSYVWRMLDVEAAVAAYYNIDVNELEDSHFKTYMKDVFPRKYTNPSAKMLDEAGQFTKEYIKPFWRQDYWFSASTGSVTDEKLAKDSEGCKMAEKATYDETGYKAGRGMKYYQDSCLVVPYKTTITKSVAQREAGNTSAAKVVYDMNQNQRVVDFVLYPKLERESGIGVSGAAEVKTVVHVTDTLPKGLSYIDGSAYLGGTYTQDPTYQTKGTVDGGIQEDKTVAESGVYLQQYSLNKNSDGTTTIEWRFPVTINANETTWTEPIYFSCIIGTQGDEENDVKNNQLLTNNVTIWSEGEEIREYKLTYGNMAEYGIKIAKSGALSLSKLADQLLADWWDSMGFTMNIGNNSSTPIANVVIAETLPANGVNGSSFHGKLIVSEFSAGTLKSKEDSDELLKNLNFYYTTDTKYIGKTSAEIKTVMGTTSFAESSDWKKLVLSEAENIGVGRPYGLFKTEDGKSFPLPEENQEQITAIVAVGILPANKTLKMHITFKLPNGQAQDTLVNYLSHNKLVSSAKTSVVNRTLEGLTWKDDDGDGNRDSNEKALSGVKVSLLKLNTSTGQYEEVCYPDTNIPISIETGQQVSVQASWESKITTYTGTNDAYTSSRYKFTDLEAGTYAVKFEDGTTVIKDFIASPANHITNDSTDSDGIPTYENKDSQKQLTSTIIKGIKLEAAKLLTSGTGESKYHDSGFYERGYELPKTGGIGTGIYTGGGLAMMATAGAMLVYNRKKRDEDECA